jgi:arginyl-tRNA synthetase
MKKQRLIKIFEESTRALGIEPPSHIEIEIPRNEAFGDLSATLALSLSKITKKPPKQMAQEIINAMPDKSAFAKVDIAGPGFINLTYTREHICSEMRQLIISKSDYLREDTGKGKKIQIEFVSANPTGPLHLGHGRGAAVGAALANLLTAAGYQVDREYYINDAGRQVKLLGLSVFAAYQQQLGNEYPLPEDGYKGAYVDDIAREFHKEQGGKYTQERFENVSGVFIDFAYQRILSGIKRDLEDFGIPFDIWQSERELFSSGEVEKAMNDLKQKSYIYEKDGALWFRATAFGDDKDRVVIKQDAEYTYFTSDIAYHRKKIERRYDELIDIWGADHHGYIPRMHAVIEALGYPKEKLKVLLVQMVTLLRGGKPVQMSKRAGEFVTLKEVIDEVGADTTKFIFLTRRPDSQLEFDLETAKAQSSENPVFYVQYANARINSIFAHARERGISVEALCDADLNTLTAPEELRIIKKLLTYPMIFEGAVNAHEPHRVTFYLQELAGMFHPYYNKHKVVGDDPVLTTARLTLCEAVRIVLKDGLEILGITAPEKM